MFGGLFFIHNPDFITLSFQRFSDLPQVSESLTCSYSLMEQRSSDD